MTAPTKPVAPSELSGIDAIIAGVPMAQTPRGGAETGFAGETIGSQGARPTDATQPDAKPDFAGLGPLLELSDKDLFQLVHGLVLRQELLKKNHLAIDSHWTVVHGGYPWSTLTHDTGKDVWTWTLPYGASALTIQAVPNKNADLINKTAETLLVDFPEAEAEPLDSSEEAEAACDMANRFLAIDAGEQGTNDAVLFRDRIERALIAPTSYLECWVDPVGGGYVPLQIQAHPQAVDVNNPYVDGQGNPTTDLVMRYVTQNGQFTDDPTQAAPQWQPRLRASKWGREHLRVFPESATVNDANKVIILGFTTLGDAKTRWDAVAKMNDAQLTSLCDWTPPRYIALLPPALRARWKLADAKEKEKAGSSDERIMFYYHVYQRATPEHRKGADVVLSGVAGGLVIDRNTMSVDVDVKKQNGTMKETRCLEIPVVQLTPCGDPSGQDPTGKAYIELFAGATENTARLANSFAKSVEDTLNLEKYIPSTSPVTGDEVENARATGDLILITKPEDKPIFGQAPILPASFFNMYELADEAVNSMAAQERAAQGSETSKERSGRALQIAVNRNNVTQTSKNNALHSAYSRWCRIKIEQAMAKFTTTQQISYVGEDGSSKQQSWTGVDFALVGKVIIKSGTGTMMDPDSKVQYLGNLRAAGMIDPAEAADAARPAFAKRLGLAANPHEQYVERCLDAWRQGPPQPKPGEVDPATGQPVTWQSKYQAWKAAQDQYAQAMAVYQQQAQAYQVALQNTAIVNAGPAPSTIGPEQQNATANDQFARAQLDLAMNPLGVQPQQPPPPTVPKPWTPFTARPNDTEPAIAAIWFRKLSKVMSSTKYDAFGPEWRDVLDRQYTMARQAVATATGAQPAAMQHGPQRPNTAAGAPGHPAPNQAPGTIQTPQPGQQPGAQQ